ncbi:hypothetical protein ABEB36_007163 [Hypothenemus hampei]|uniref:Uncharacterized protein n=1 Tax=Hypothenemus hampei TaxID=57062 RepID=A0ABD1EX04_HYPHA
MLSTSILLHTLTFSALFPLFLCLVKDCKPYNQSCTVDRSCCGGCCLKGFCKDTYLDCRANTEDPCIRRYCPEGQVCTTYQPSGCKGCGPLVECVVMSIPEDLKHRSNFTHYHRLNSAHSFKINLWIFFWLFVGWILLKNSISYC